MSHLRSNLRIIRSYYWSRRFLSMTASDLMMRGEIDQAVCQHRGTETSFPVVTPFGAWLLARCHAIRWTIHQLISWGPCLWRGHDWDWDQCRRCKEIH